MIHERLTGYTVVVVDGKLTDHRGGMYRNPVVRMKIPCLSVA